MAVVRGHPIYAGRDPVTIPAYSVVEAAHHLQLPLATVRSWVIGRRYHTEAGERLFKPLVWMAQPRTRLLSFRDLAELHVLGAIRRQHGIKISAIRKAITFVRKSFNTHYPLSDQQMLTDGRDLFIERYGQFVSVSEQGQMAFKNVLDMFLQRIERDAAGMPIRLYPFTRTQIQHAPQAVVIDPRIQFGQPCVAGTGIPTAIIMERYQAGDSIVLLAQDYRRPAHDIEEAIRYEAA